MTADDFLPAILAAPNDDDDDTPRLVFADWLDEQDTAPDRQYARFMRSQVRGDVFSLSLVASLRFEALFGGQPHTWRKRSSAGVCEVEAANGAFVFRRGFVDEVRLTLGAFAEHAAELFAAHPITRVVLTDRHPTVGDENDPPLYAWTDVYTGLGDLPEYLPPEIHDRLPGGTLVTDYGWVGRGYPTREAAIDALSTACVRYGRQAAKLDPLPVG